MSYHLPVPCPVLVPIADAGLEDVGGLDSWSRAAPLTQGSCWEYVSHPKPQSLHLGIAHFLGNFLSLETGSPRGRES